MEPGREENKNDGQSRDHSCLTLVESYQIADNHTCSLLDPHIQTNGFFVTGSNHLMDFVDSSENTIGVDRIAVCLSPFGLL